MSQLKPFACFGLAAGLMSIAYPAWAAAPITGSWITQSGNSLVTIAPCGKAFCGHVVKQIRAPNGVTTDQKNPDPKLRGRPIVGVALLHGLTDNGAAWKGKVYVPGNGKTYNVEVTRQADGRLQLKGCMLFVCQTQYWTAAR